MREAARALDDVSDHLGEVLRHADELLAEWARFGAQVRTQVEREASAIGEVVDGAVTRAASSGIDRAIAEKLRTLTGEIERLEQRARAASRAVAEQHAADRRVLWIVVAGIVLANALLVMLLLRKPEAAPVAEPVRVDAIPEPVRAATPAAGSADPATAGSAAVAPSTPQGSNAPTDGVATSNAGSGAGLSAADAKLGSNAPVSAAVKPMAVKPSGAGAGAAKPTASPIVLPPKARGHKKQP